MKRVHKKRQYAASVGSTSWRGHLKLNSKATKLELRVDLDRKLSIETSRSTTLDRKLSNETSRYEIEE